MPTPSRAAIRAALSGDCNEESKGAFEAVQTKHGNNPLPRSGRMIVCVLTMGFVFSTAFSESVDIDDYKIRSKTRTKDQQLQRRRMGVPACLHAAAQSRILIAAFGCIESR